MNNMKLFIEFCILALSLSKAGTLNFHKGEKVPEGRITNGHNAAVSQFPYMAYIFPEANSKNITFHRCGGSLIHHEWVLTAAQCLAYCKRAKVYLGATDIRDPNVIYPVSSADFIVHRSFALGSFKSDIALIRIPYTIYTTYISPVRLSIRWDKNCTLPTQIAVMAGYGLTANATYPTHLQWADFTVIDNSICKITYGKYIEASTLCIYTSDGVGPCLGDGGSPLVLKSTNQQIGLYSFAYSPNCTGGGPAVFTRIISYRSWIYRKMALNGPKNKRL